MSRQEYPRLGEAISQRILPNGLAVIVVHKPFHAKHYAFFATSYGGMALRYKVGDQWRDTPAGVAHYLEHKMFDTEHESATQALAKNGAVENAFTANDMTAYYFECTEKFYDSLRILLQFVSVPYFTQESVEKEQGIIAQEIRMSDDDPEWQNYLNIIQCLYQHHPMRTPVVGTVDSIATITPQLLYDCHKTFYTPSNMVLVCIGSMDIDEVCAVAQEILPTEAGTPVERDYGAVEDLTPATRLMETEMEVSMPQFVTGYKCAVPESGVDYLRENIIGSMACDVLFGDSSPLYNRLYEEGHINGSLGGSFDVIPNASFLYVGGDANDPHFVSEEITREAMRLAKEGIDEEFYQQIRRATYGQLLRGLNSFEDTAISMADGHFRGFDYYSFPEVFDRVTKADIEEFLRRNIVPEHSAISIIYPKADGKENS